MREWARVWVLVTVMPQVWIPVVGSLPSLRIPRSLFETLPFGWRSLFPDQLVMGHPTRASDGNLV